MLGVLYTASVLHDARGYHNMSWRGQTALLVFWERQCESLGLGLSTMKNTTGVFGCMVTMKMIRVCPGMTSMPSYLTDYHEIIIKGKPISDEKHRFRIPGKDNVRSKRTPYIFRKEYKT